MTKPKQVILVRSDLNMPVGKIASQVAHASMKVFFDKANIEENEIYSAEWQSTMKIRLSEKAHQWVTGEFTKVVLEVFYEEQLLAMYARAQLAGLPTALIQDNGHTVFNGVKTFTAVAIGPADPAEIDAITGKLKLLN